MKYYKMSNKYSPHWPTLYKVDRGRLYTWKYISRTWDYHGWKKQYKGLDLYLRPIDESYVFLKIFESESSLLGE